MKRDEFIALLPLRGGSKGIPNKNIKPFFGQPLCFWTLKALVGSKRIGTIAISTDSAKIRKTIEEFNFPKIKFLNRSEVNATDSATTESVLLESAGQLKFKNMVLVQATNPFLVSEDLDQAIDDFVKKKLDSSLSVVLAHRFYWNINKNGLAKATNYSPMKRPRRQDWSGSLVENGSFYITTQKALFKSKCRLSGKIGAHIMPDYSYHELDSPNDWIVGEKIFSVHHQKKLTSDLSKIKLLAMDVDGVLTDSGMYYSDSGEELKKFNTRDGKGIELLKAKGIDVAIITSEKTVLLEKRASKLKISHLHQGISDKLSCIKDLAKKLGLSLNEIAYIGDDINDTETLNHVGVSFSPQDAIWDNKKIVDYVCHLPGGQGCVREVCEILLNNKMNE